MKNTSLVRFVFLTLSIAALTGCGAGGQGGGGSRTIDLGTLLPLVGTEQQTMLFVREEEKMARDVYMTLYNQWLEPTFYNIATKSEQKHMDSVKAMLDNLGIADPVVSDATGAFTNTAIAGLYTQLVTRGAVSLNQALLVGAYIEEYDIVDVQHAKDEIIAGSNQTPIILTYDNLLCGSRNHLRSFVSRMGVAYTAQIITQTEVDAITSTPSEQCGI
ncbi:MAG: ferritin [Sideroxydans sp.]|nr:ferritin [Sideroxydans sp.]